MKTLRTNKQDINTFNQSIGSETGFNNKSVQQGSTSPRVDSNEIAYVPLNNRIIALPTDTLERIEINLSKTVQRTQNNNLIVALSVLQSAVNTFLQFEKAFKSLFSKGDDHTQLHNLRKCIVELKQANLPQNKVLTHELSWLVTLEDPLITNTRELFEHCIKVIEEFIPLLGGRIIDTYDHEKVRQFIGWSGWQQQSEQIRVSNRALEFLLNKLIVIEEPNGSVYQEIRAFQKSVDYILDGFMDKQYPKRAVIEGIYTENKVQFITTKLNLNTENTNLNKSENELKLSDDVVQSGGIFSCFSNRNS